MEETFHRIWENLVGRFSGPMTFRLVLQPLMAIAFAIRDGYKDARQGRPAYFWDLFSGDANARSLLLEGWKAVARVFVLAMGMDLIYQFLVFRWFYPLESLIVAVVLAILPYLLLRGPANRIFRHFVRKKS